MTGTKKLVAVHWQHSRVQLRFGTKTIWVCQGPPRCLLEMDDAVAAQEEGCQFCKRILVDENGMERTIEPGNA
tara:strand:+ start:293 stop:511 length:219 start_codon:yes stop_codon:yes gene_type:complete